MKIGMVIKHCRKFHSSRYAVETSKEFVKNHSVDIFTNNWDPLDKRITIHKVPVFSSNFYLQEVSFTTLASLILAKHSFDVTLAQPTRYFSPSVAEMQFVYKAWADYKKKSGLPLNAQDKIIPSMEGYNLRKAKAVIAISSSIKNEVMKFHGIPEEKIHVIHNAVDPKEFAPGKEKYRKEIRDRFNLYDEDFVIYFAGSPFVRKGLKYLIEAFSKLKGENLKLVITEGKKADPTKYIEQVSKLGIEDRVIFTGRTTEIQKFFAASDIFVLPSLYEPFGIVILEAMSSGLPVIVSAATGAADLITDNKNGMLIKNPRNPKEIVEKMNDLIKNDSLRKSLGRNARKTAENHTWKNCAEKMMEVFESTL